MQLRLAALAVLTALLVGCGGVSQSDSSTALPAQTMAPSLAGGSFTATPGRETARVTRVVDGDTIDVELNGSVVRIRYIGMDTPETVDPASPVECFGPQASGRNRALVEGRTVELEKDVSETDRYGRLLRYVYAGGQMVNEELVLEGYATAATFPPDVKYQRRLADAERQARQANRGLWAGCIDATPTPSSSGCPSGCFAPPSGCEIKGNINSDGVKIYHVPSGAFYDATIIDTSRGERWFCTPEEAVANGWRPSQR